MQVASHLAVIDSTGFGSIERVVRVPARHNPEASCPTSVARVREWLVLLGYEVVTTRGYLYCSPWRGGRTAAVGTGRLLHRSIFNPLPAGAYLIKARKRLYTLTPVRTRFREKPAVLGGLVKPTTRQPSRS